MAFLLEAPYDNAYLYSLIEAGTGPMYVARGTDGSLRGVCYDGPNIVFATADPADVDAFAAAPLGSRSTRMIVGPRAAVERFWPRAKHRFPRPTVVRNPQYVYALRPPTFAGAPPLEPGVDVRAATLDELDELSLEAARMAAGEFGVPAPSRVDFAFRSRTAQAISSGRFWRARRDGALVFQCYVGAVSPSTAQIQGVWSPPDKRGRGEAHQAFSTICAALLETHASLSLYVNAFNAPAIALYERVGYVRVSEFATLFF